MKFGSHSNIESLTQKIKTSLPIFRDFFPHDKMWLLVELASWPIQVHKVFIRGLLPYCVLGDVSSVINKYIENLSIIEINNIGKS